MLYGRSFTTVATLSVFLWIGSVTLELMSINHKIVPQVATWITVVAAVSTSATVQIWVASHRGPRTSQPSSAAMLERTTLTRVVRVPVYTGSATVPAPREADDAAQIDGESTIEWRTRRTTVQQRVRDTVDRLPKGAWRDAYNLGRKAAQRELKSKPETP